ALTELRRCQRERAERPSVESTDESDVARPASGVAGQLHGAFDRLCPGVGEEHLGRRSWKNLRLEALRELDLGPVIEVGSGHVEESIRLLHDRRYNSRMGVTGGRDGNPRC